MTELRSEPLACRFTPQMLDGFTADARAWHESPEDVQRGLAEGRRKAHLLAWVRAHMATDLTPREARFVEAYYFAGHSQPRIAHMAGCHTSTVCRVLQRAVCRLRQAAQADRSWTPYADDRVPRI